jgi:hypothetical protein
VAAVGFAIDSLRAEALPPVDDVFREEVEIAIEFLDSEGVENAIDTI